MKLNKLVLTNFRNHSLFNYEFNGKSLLIIGPNGKGKTNIVESINFLATTKSFKATYDREIINYDCDYARVQALISTNQDDYELEIFLQKSERFQNSSSKKVKVNKVSKTLNYFSGILNCVIFTPGDMELLTGSPSNRRKYIDSILIQTNKDYKKNLSQYTKAVRQRNKLLEQIKEFNTGHRQLEFWDEKVLNLGINIQKARKELFEFVKPLLQKYSAELDNKNWEYKIVYDINKINTERMQKYKQKEIASKNTLVGPHRDDFNITFNSHDIASFGSRGQQRSVMLALKQAEIDFITEKNGMRPILLLDDIFSEFDENHKNAVKKIIPLQQTIITSAENIEYLDTIETLEL